MCNVFSLIYFGFLFRFGVFSAGHVMKNWHAKRCGIMTAWCTAVAIMGGGCVTMMPDTAAQQAVFLTLSGGRNNVGLLSRVFPAESI